MSKKNEMQNIIDSLKEKNKNLNFSINSLEKAVKTYDIMEQRQREKCKQLEKK